MENIPISLWHNFIFLPGIMLTCLPRWTSVCYVAVLFGLVVGLLLIGYLDGLLDGLASLMDG